MQVLSFVAEIEPKMQMQDGGRRQLEISKNCNLNPNDIRLANTHQRTNLDATILIGDGDMAENRNP